MNKYFVFILLVFAGLVLVSCDKGKDQNNAENPQENPQTNPQDSTEINPLPYLRVDDLMPLQMISLRLAEEKLAERGYEGGWQTYTRCDDGKLHEQQNYLYFSEDKKDSIVLYPNSEGLIEGVEYYSSRGVVPSEAKAWLTHIPEKVNIPEKIAEIVGREEIAFNFMQESGKNNIECSTYSEFLETIKNLSSGMFILAAWGEVVPRTAPSGYYGGFIAIKYSYSNNVDAAYLSLSFAYHEQKNDPEPAGPGDE